MDSHSLQLLHAPSRPSFARAQGLCHSPAGSVSVSLHLLTWELAGSWFESGGRRAGRCTGHTVGSLVASDANMDAWGLLKFNRARAEALSEGWRVARLVEEHVFDRATAFTARAMSTDQLLWSQRLLHLWDCPAAGGQIEKESFIFKPALEKYGMSLLISSVIKIICGLGLKSCFKAKTMSEC